MADISQYNDSVHVENPEHFAFSVTERPDLTASVICAFSDGLGVEDIGALGIATTEYARAVLKRLTASGLTESLYRKGKAKKPDNTWNPISGLAAALVDDAMRKMAAARE